MLILTRSAATVEKIDAHLGAPVSDRRVVSNSVGSGQTGSLLVEFSMDTAMPEVLIQDVDENVLKALRQRARQQGRSLQAELKSILEEAAKSNVAMPRELPFRIRRSLGSSDHSDSVVLYCRGSQAMTSLVRNASDRGTWLRSC